MADETQAVQQVISRYHQAITDKDADTALNCIGETYLQFRKRGDRWEGNFHGSSGSTDADEFRSMITSDDHTYTNSTEFIDTNIANKNTAVVVTKETGSETGSAWEGVTNLWFLAHQGGEWKIVGSGHAMPE